MEMNAISEMKSFGVGGDGIEATTHFFLGISYYTLIFPKNGKN